jgi:hypothetical protein
MRAPASRRIEAGAAHAFRTVPIAASAGVAMPMSDAGPQAVISPVTVSAVVIAAPLDPGDGAGERIALATPGDILPPIRAAHISHG